MCCCVIVVLLEAAVHADGWFMYSLEFHCMDVVMVSCLFQMIVVL